jgi:crotonobetainyl-CoA:carnitine CoA-transferase CaiB-like acyl-CoA transferase
MSQWFDEEEMDNPFDLVENPGQLDMAGLSEETLNAFESMIGKLFLKHTKKEIMARTLTTDIQAWILSTPVDVLENLNLKERDFWSDLEHDKSAFNLDYPGHYFLSNQTDTTLKYPAPLVGEHNTEIFTEMLGITSDEVTELKESNVI